MGAYAGHSLDCIIKYKEAERKATGGFFFWGVAQKIVPPKEVKELAKNRIPIRIIFSKVKNDTKKPATSETYIWRKYDYEGQEIELPKGVLLTGGPKESYYALVCWSDIPLDWNMRRCEKQAFDPGAFRTIDGKQVSRRPNTVFLKKPDSVSSCESVTDNKWTENYFIEMEAWLTGEYVTQARGSESVSTEDVLSWNPEIEDWAEFVNQIRGG